jgi:hypothetical protein
MRFVFGDLAVGQELRARQQMLGRMDRFWEAFAQAGGERSALTCRRLRAVHPSLDWYRVPWVGSGSREAVISSDDWCLQPLIEALIARGSSRLPEWHFGSSRPALGFEHALISVPRGTILSSAQVRVGISRGHLLEVVVHVPESVNDESMMGAFESVVEALVGQRIFETWLEQVSVAPLARGGPLRVVGSGASSPTTAPISSLGDLVERAVSAVVAGLPERPLHTHCASLKWTMFETEPVPADDYVGQDDLLLSTTLAPELLKSYLQGAPFSSQRFSRNDEVFCYLKTENPTAGIEQLVARRTELEDELDAELREAGAGCVIGNGLGLRYSYIDLALSQPGVGLPLVRRVARSRDVFARSWILFCDTAWTHEWIGIWDDAPPPGGPP